MKRILFLALGALLVAAAPVASAQLKGSADQQKYVETAKLKAEVPKNAAKAATWMKVGDSYFKSYTDVTGGIQLGQDEMNVNFLIQAKPVATEQIALDGVQTLKVIYATVNLYYQGGVVAGIEPTDWAYPDGLLEAAKAYDKAREIDPKKEKDILLAFDQIENRLNQLGITWNLLGNQELSSKYFEQAFEVSAIAAVEKDFDALYNAGLTAWLGKDFERSRDIYLRSIAEGFENNGEVYAKLGEIFDVLGDQASRKSYLEEGFAKFPENQSILVSLINYADQAGEDPNYILSLLAKAKENDPGNASIYSVEGNLYAQMKRYDEAVAAFHESIAVDPNYLYAYYAEGKMWYDYAVEIQAQIDELPWNAPASQINKLDADLTGCLEKAIPAMELCFEKAEDVQYKVAAADVLRRCYFSLRNDHEGYEEKAAFYKTYVETNAE